MNIPDPKSKQPKDASKVARRKIKPEPPPPQVPIQPGENYDETNFGQSVLFQQSRSWSRGIIWTIVLISTGLVAWAAFAKIDEAIPAQGKLEPIDKVKDVQVPVGGVVKEVLVKEGDKVKIGDKLLRLESTVPQSQLSALQQNKTSIAAETRFYRSLLNPNGGTFNETDLLQLKLKPEILALTKSRTAIVAENKLFRAELNGTTTANLTAEEQQRLTSSKAELNSRLNAGQLEVNQMENQMRENRVKRSGIENLLATGKAAIANIQAKVQAQDSQLKAQIDQNRIRHQTAKTLFDSNQKILDKITPAVKAGALSSNQFLKQEQEVTARRSEVAELDQEYNKLQQQRQELLANARIETQNQEQQITQQQNQIDQLDEEYNRLKYASSQSQEKLKNSLAGSQKDLLARIADNDKRLAEIDSQLNKAIVENEKKIAEIDSQIAQAKLNLKYQDVVATATGTIFELKAGSPGFVANPSEPVMKIVPDDKLVAKVFITNKDIGFVKVGSPVDVRIDSFPFSEFGDVKGTLEWVGSDALPPDQANPYERFPAKIKLDRQNLIIRGEKKTLQSGMSLSANIKLRDRTILSIFTDQFMKQQDALKNVR
jgi:HlyD family secretion protein